MKRIQLAVLATILAMVGTLLWFSTRTPATVESGEPLVAPARASEKLERVETVVDFEIAPDSL